ncbi:MAG: Fis family transcriptional regulator [Methylococcaceae bacterium]|nr:Fis family transcriptional regulator [Methylococcaceae bacterium]MCI0733787.1 Fis family transcriptional regulator [Methylococcaceae bacterium]
MKPDSEYMAFEMRSPGQVSNRQLTLCEYVRTAVEQYFRQINGHPACNLYEFVIAEVEKPLIETVLKHLGYNQSKAALTLGISRSTLRKKIDRYGLE